MIFMKKKNKSPSPLGIRLLNPMIMRLVLYRDAATAANQNYFLEQLLQKCILVFLKQGIIVKIYFCGQKLWSIHKQKISLQIVYLRYRAQNLDAVHLFKAVQKNTFLHSKRKINIHRELSIGPLHQLSNALTLQTPGVFSFRKFLRNAQFMLRLVAGLI